ncbi:acetyl-CoA C-acetyltransferase [Paenibacillus sp. GCM10027627]|uniref:acetyl-CoA C-acetyltransferase n=1 Tax=unclassified Paenibacillus TaxID=185978 RepID=UPI003628B380
MSVQTVIVSAARTPIGKFGGALKEASAVRLGGIAIRGAVERAGIAGADVDKVIMGMVLQGGSGQNPARQAAFHGGLPWETAAEAVNKVCASGLRAIAMADQCIRAGDGEVIVAGGMESMSGALYALPGIRFGKRMGHDNLIDLMLRDGLTCPFGNAAMTEYGNSAAEQAGLTRYMQDDWALRSHLRAVQAAESGIWAEEIVPVPLSGGGGMDQAAKDEAPRKDAGMEALSKLPSLFPGGTITAGNAPGICDGAAAVVCMSNERAGQSGTKPLGIILGHAEVALRPKEIADAPALALQKLLGKTGYTLPQIDRFEINEAFAAVVLKSGGIAGWNPEKVNVHGGAIALGHPIGASGARIIVTLLHELRRIGGGMGIAAICSGTGQGDAILIKVEKEG